MPLPALLLSLLIVLGSAGCGDKPAGPPPRRPPAPVAAALAQKRDVPVYIDEIGRCAPREMVVIKPLVAGRITEVHVADGASVKQGDPLFTIDPRPYQQAVDQAKATLAQHQAVLELSRGQMARYQALLASNGMSRDAVEEKRSNLAVAEAQVAASQAALSTAQLNLEHCTIRSPIEGRAGKRLMDLGNVVKASGDEPMLVIERLDPIYADFSVTEAEFSAVQGAARTRSLSVEVRKPDDLAHPRTGELTFIDNTIDAATGTVKLRATLKNDDQVLWPGLFVNVRLILTVLRDAVLVPAGAVQISAKGPFVYVIDTANKAQLRLVKTGQNHGDHVVVSEGVKPGERVVTLGHLAVAPGAEVRVAAP